MEWPKAPGASSDGAGGLEGPEDAREAAAEDPEESSFSLQSALWGRG